MWMKTNKIKRVGNWMSTGRSDNKRTFSKVLIKLAWGIKQTNINTGRSLTNLWSPEMLLILDTKAEIRSYLWNIPSTAHDTVLMGSYGLFCRREWEHGIKNLQFFRNYFGGKMYCFKYILKHLKLEHLLQQLMLPQGLLLHLILLQKVARILGITRLCM